MLTRIVKMSFHEENIPKFLENFDLVKLQIRNVQGNRYLKLYQDLNDKNIFYTYSHWDSEEDLNKYRESELFFGVWDFTKKLFNAKPTAWSLNEVCRLE